MFEWLTNYKIMIPILVAIVLGALAYYYLFRKTPGEKLAEIKQDENALREMLGKKEIHYVRAPPKNPELEEEAEAEGEFIEDDNVTRESLYEEILKLNLLKNPVDFIFSTGPILNFKQEEPRTRRITEIKPDVSNQDGLSGLDLDIDLDLEDLDEDDEASEYPPEDFGLDIADKIEQDMLKLDTIIADMDEPVIEAQMVSPGQEAAKEGLNPGQEIKKKKIITIKKK